MYIEVVFPTGPLASTTLRDYDAELDDIRSLLDDICELIEDSSRFTVCGFGQSPWPLDMKTDLPVLLEQLPGALDAIRSFRPFKLEFYEQGIERVVSFSPHEDEYIATCESFGSWQPAPDPERISRTGVKEALVRIRDGFVLLIHRNFHDIETQPLLQSWLKQL